MEQNPFNNDATEIAQSRADLFGLNVVKTRQLYLLQLITLDSLEDESYTSHIIIRKQDIQYPYEVQL